jgi:hypothetical protein
MHLQEVRVEELTRHIHFDFLSFNQDLAMHIYPCFHDAMMTLTE